MANNTTPFKSLLFFVQKRFLQTHPSSPISTSSSPPRSPSFTVQYLTRSCGFPLQPAISISQTLKRNERYSQNYDRVVNFLKSHGFSDAQIAKLVVKRPAIICARVDTKLKPKFEFLIENGFVGSLLPDLILRNPLISARGLSSQIQPSFGVLRKYLMTNDNIVSAVMRSSWLLTVDFRIIQMNIDFLISEQVPIETISKLIVAEPRAILQKLDKVASALSAVKDLGVRPNAPPFLLVFRAIVSMSDLTFKRKVELFKSLWWSEEEIISCLKRDPFCLRCSEEKIMGAMDFFVNTLKLEPRVIINYPKFLTYSFEKRIRPRYKILKLLESKGMIELNDRVVWVLVQPEMKFLKNYVNKYLDQVPNLMELYSGSIAAYK